MKQLEAYAGPRLDKTRLSDSVFASLYECITTGRIRPGDWFRQEQIAKDLEVSQGTVREALNRLVADGLAEQIPRKGVRAIAIRLEDISDIYELRLECERKAWKAAIPLITEQEIMRMRELLADSATTEDPSSVESARRANMEFHLIPIIASKRRYLIKVLGELMSLNNHHLLMVSKSPELRAKDGAVNRDEHLRLVSALETGDDAEVDSLIRSHIGRAMRDRLALFGKD